MTKRFDYSAARWNRLSRSVRRLNDDVVEIRNLTNNMAKMGVRFMILLALLLSFVQLYIISGQRVTPPRPSSFATLEEMLEREYLQVMDFETFLIPYWEQTVKQYEDRAKIYGNDPAYPMEPMISYEEFYQKYADWMGETPWKRFNEGLKSYGLGPVVFILMLMVPAMLFTPSAPPIRLDSRRRVVYTRGWHGLKLKRYFGMLELRKLPPDGKSHVLERLFYSTEMNLAVTPLWQRTRANRAMQIAFPGKKPPMIHLREDGVINGAMQRFPLGSYPMRKNQVEEIGQFIEDFFEHPDPGSWTKNLHWRYPLWSDIPAWLIGFDLYPFPHYNNAKTDAQVDRCLEESEAL